MKIGISGTKKSELRDRMYGTAHEITRTIRQGTDRTETFKNIAKAPILAGKRYEVWAKQYPLKDLIDEETRLTEKYDPPLRGSI
jgi:hypothetical protein